MHVIVSGASVAGLHTALYLLSSNLDVNVTMVERKKAIGEDIICAGGLSSYMLKKLNLEIPEEFVACKVKKVRFYSPSFDYAELELKKEFGLILWRDRWEKWLGSRVEELGAKILLREHLSPEMLKGADVIVGADGLMGASRKLVGCQFPSREDVHVGIQAVGKATLEDDAISMFWGSQIAPDGYGWAFPIGGSNFRIGLGVPLSMANHLRSHFKTLISSIDAEVDKPKVKLIPTAPPERRLVHGNVALVGDAGLQTDPAHGGGIANAILGAKCLCEALNHGSLKAYDKLWRRELFRRNKQRYRLKQVLCELEDGEFDMLVDCLKDFKPLSESLGMALIHLILHLALKHPRFVTRHKILRRLFT